MIVFEKQHQPIDMPDTNFAMTFQKDFSYMGSGGESAYPYVIKEHGKVLGYLFGDFNDDETYFYIEYIEVVNSLKEQGYGTRIVHAMFDALHVNTLGGNVMNDDSGRAYYFWSSLGAFMDVNVEEYEQGETDDISFELRRTDIAA